ncbi:MAG: NADH-quinone oxidoreductase subunit H [Myxococcales bacterium]|nr:NADH-quinone oxidoreductase subunit H [Myxococcales bacterium]
MRRALPLAVAPAALAFWGCSLEPPAALVSAMDVSPRDAEVGDRIEVIGAGFPEGKPATLSFRGDLHRPGQEPIRRVEIVVPAVSTSAHRVALTLTEELQRELCGRGASADHTTFRGDVTVAFAARTTGAPPITGVVPNVVIDVHGPAVPTELSRAREAESKRALDFIGVKVDEKASLPPFVVTAVLPGSRGERAGILPADTIVAVDGVNARSLADFTFAADTTSTFTLSRGRLKEPIERAVDVQGFRERAPKELAVSGVLIGCIVMLFALWLAPVARMLGWIERRVASRLRDRVASKKTVGNRRARLWTAVQASIYDDLAPRGEPFFVRLLPYALFLGTSAAATTLAFGKPLVSVDLDLALIAGSSTTLLVLVALASAGWHAKGHWSFRIGLKGAFAALALQLPILAALAAVVLTTGSVRIADIVNGQGATPWGWNAFRNPALFFAAGLILFASFPEARRPTQHLPEADLDEPGPRGGLMFYVEWGHLLVVSTLVTMLFLGGWKLPVAPAAPGGVWLPALGAVLLQLKCWAVVGLVVALRWALPRVHTDQMLGVLFRYVVPGTLLVLAGSAGWASWRESPAWRAVEPVLGYVLFGLALGAALKFVRAVHAHVRATGAPMHVNPWL